MNEIEIIEKFKSIIEKDKYGFITPTINKLSIIGQGINFDICNSVPTNTKRTYLEIDSLEQAETIWTKVLSDLSKEKQVEEVFDNNIPDDLDLFSPLFMSIYSGNK
ncbi:hypothetical protein [Yeosuana marina]|uniref:hypothetical protein n=1 Tax=Yeosuana marina TaxID=1565536 RepID=UPI0030EB8F23|tara:strand:+ start:812 stop:1129 length:318 start_codon:yes stop_codon:yes gene_type:complete